MTLANNPQSASGRTTGSAWIDRFLLPHLIHRFGDGRPLLCLQIAPDDPSEATRLGELGHPCHMVELATNLEVRSPAETYDFAFTGRFPVLAPDRKARITLASELYRVLRKGGSLLVACGNRLSPIDLTHNGPFLHGPGAAACLSMGEVDEIFLREAQFSAIHLLSVYRHFGWARLPGWSRALSRLADSYWRILATPSRPWLYSSPLNPILLLWIDKN